MWSLAEDHSGNKLSGPDGYSKVLHKEKKMTLEFISFISRAYNQFLF